MKASRVLEKWWTVGGVAGIVCVCLFVGPAALLADEPRFSDSGQAIMGWYQRDSDRWLTGIFLLGIASAFFFLPFLSALTSLLSSAEGEPPMWSRVTGWGGLLYIAVEMPGLGGEGIVSYLTKGAGPEVARAGMAFALFVYSLSGFFAAVFVLSASIVILRYHTFWPWLGWYGIVLAAVNVVGAAAIFDTPDGPLGVIRTRVAPPGLAIWMVAASIGMLRLSEAPQIINLPARARRT
jgi:hypothetical protein